MRPHSRCLGFFLAGVVLLGVVTSVDAAARLALTTDDVVVFAGGTNMLHLQQAGYLEAMLTRAFAAARPRFRDLSWEADTVFRQGTGIERGRTDGFGKRDDQLKRVGATVVIAQFIGIGIAIISFLRSELLTPTQDEFPFTRRWENQ